MTMRNMLFTAHWTPAEVDSLLNFLADLQGMIETHYAEELQAFYQEITQRDGNHHHDYCDFVDDDIPF